MLFLKHAMLSHSARQLRHHLLRHSSSKVPPSPDNSRLRGLTPPPLQVLVGAHALLANGGVIGACGTHMVALAAKRHSIPFVVLVGLHKLSPLFPHDPDVTLNDFRSPADVVDAGVLAEAYAANDGPSTSALNVEVHNPTYDYIPPHLVSLFVTDTGGYTPQVGIAPCIASSCFLMVVAVLLLVECACLAWLTVHAAAAVVAFKSSHAAIPAASDHALNIPPYRTVRRRSTCTACWRSTTAGRTTLWIRTMGQRGRSCCQRRAWARAQQRLWGQRAGRWAAAAPGPTAPAG